MADLSDYAEQRNVVPETPSPEANIVSMEITEEQLEIKPNDKEKLSTLENSEEQVQIDNVSTENLQNQGPGPVLERDEKGRITRGIAQDTNKYNTAGQPCELCSKMDETLKKIVDYYNQCVDSLEGGKIKFIQRATLARKLNVDQSTLYRWEQDEVKHPEYCKAMRRIKDLQEEILTIRVLGKTPLGSMFLLRVNHGYIETEKKILAGGNKDDKPLEIRIVEDKPNV